MKYPIYSIVKITALHKTFSNYGLSFCKRAPVVGDKATIIEVYDKPTLGYELECSDGKGDTEWLLTFSPKDAEFEVMP